MAISQTSPNLSDHGTYSFLQERITSKFGLASGIGLALDGLPFTCLSTIESGSANRSL